MVRWLKLPLFFENPSMEAHSFSFREQEWWVQARGLFCSSFRKIAALYLRLFISVFFPACQRGSEKKERKGGHGVRHFYSELLRPLLFFFLSLFFFFDWLWKEISDGGGFCVFPDDRFWEFGLPHWQSRASCELVCWKKLKCFGLQRIKLGFKALLRWACILAGVVQNKGLSKVSHHTLIVAPVSLFPATEGREGGGVQNRIMLE